MKEIMYVFMGLFYMNEKNISTEIHLSFNSGAYWYEIDDEIPRNYMFYNIVTEQGAVYLPYGNTYGPLVGTSFTLKNVYFQKILLGADIGFENLRASMIIDSLILKNGENRDYLNVTGSSYLINNNINGYPFIGYRLDLKNIKFDLIGGMDIGYNLTVRNKATLKNQDGSEYQLNEKMTTVRFDLRPRIQLTTQIYDFGFTLGYSYGLSNHNSIYKIGEFNSWSRMMRVGVQYKIK